MGVYYITIPLFIHSTLDGHLTCFQLLAFINNVAMKILHMASYIWISVKYIPRSGVTGHRICTFYGYILTDNTKQLITQSGCTSLHPHQQDLRILVTLHLCQ